MNVVVVLCRQGELPDPKSRSLEKEVEDFVKAVNKLPRYIHTWHIHTAHSTTDIHIHITNT